MKNTLLRQMTASALVLALTGLTPAFADRRHQHGTRFENVSEIIGFNRSGGEGLGGLAWLDYNADGHLDLLVTGGVGTSNGLFKNNGDGSFTNVTVESGISVFSGNASAVAGDLDNDGYPEIFMSGEGHFMGPAQTPTKLFYNNGNGSFTDISVNAGVPASEIALSAAMGDINNDGFLDLFVTAPGHLGVAFPPGVQHEDRLYLNNGNLTFTDISEPAGVNGALGSCVAAFSDYDKDGWQDLYVGVCNDVNFTPTPFHLYRNNRDNTFTDIAPDVGLDGGGFWMAAALGDINNDGRMDLFATNFGPISTSGIPRPHVLYRQNEDGTFTDIATAEMQAAEFGWGATFADFDNDGFQDLFFGGSIPPLGLVGPGLGNPGRLFFNDRQGGFVQNNAAHGIDLSSHFVSGIAQADYDNNGFPDIAILSTDYSVTNPVTGEVIEGPPGEVTLLKNAGNRNHSLTLRLKGTESNRMGIGARIEVYTAFGKRQVREVRAGSSFASSETPWPTFGLGRRHLALAKVIWPSGHKEWFFPLFANRTVELIEGRGHHLHHRRDRGLMRRFNIMRSDR